MLFVYNVYTSLYYEYTVQCIIVYLTIHNTLIYINVEHTFIHCTLICINLQYSLYNLVPSSIPKTFNRNLKININVKVSIQFSHLSPKYPL